jgi:hypothetical protein
MIPEDKEPEKMSVEDEQKVLNFVAAMEKRDKDRNDPVKGEEVSRQEAEAEAERFRDNMIKNLVLIRDVARRGSLKHLLSIQDEALKFTHTLNDVFQDNMFSKLSTKAHEIVKNEVKDAMSAMNSANQLIQERIRALNTYTEVAGHQKPNPDAGSLNLYDLEINNFNMMPLDRVRKYFMSLTKMKSSENQKPILTSLQVEEFIQRAFIGKTEIPKVRPNRGNRDAGYIRKLFYKFWEGCDRGNIYKTEGGNTQNEYISLLVNNIEGFDFKSTKDNFHKSKDIKKPLPQVEIDYVN